jgi:hypothetical protein
MKKRLLLIFVGLALVLTGCAVGSRQQRNLQSEHQISDPREESKDAKAVVLLFVTVDCPISNKYAPELQRLIDEFGPEGVKFWLVYTDPDLSTAECENHAREYGYRSRVVCDSKHELVQLAGASVTPEAAVYVNGAMVYRGRVDDRFPALGVGRAEATQRDLEEVLKMVKSGGEVRFHSTKAIGCYIPKL